MPIARRSARPPPVARHSCATGFHPPETASRFASIDRRSAPDATWTADTRGDPSVPVTIQPARTSIPRARAAACGGASGRTSTTQRSLGAGVSHGVGDRIGGVVGGEDHHPVAGEDPELPQIAQRGGGEHDPGAIVVGERDGTLVGAGGQDDALGADVPQAFDRTTLLVNDDVAIVVHAERGRAGQHRRAREGSRARAGPRRRRGLDRPSRSPTPPPPSRRPPPPTTSVSTWACRCSHRRRGARGPGSRPTPARPTASRPSASSTVVAAVIGSNRGALTSTNAHGSSDPAAITPRGRPRTGEGHTTSTPFASSADASVSPANPS